MTPSPTSRNCVRQLRQQKSWTQAELAQRSGISRTAVTAIEAGRLSPSVAAALSLAKALETSVEILFGESGETSRNPAWAMPPLRLKQPHWEAEIAGRIWRYPADTVPRVSVLPDDETRPETKSLASRTLVVAGCDPAAGFLAQLYFQRTGMRMLIVPGSSGASLELLRQGRAHLAGLHLSTAELPDENARAATAALGSGGRLLRIADWREGVAVTSRVKSRSVRSLARSKARWVGREEGSGARRCQDAVLGHRPRRMPVARDHRGVVTAISSGWADAGVCVELVCAEAGLTFLPVQQESYDLCARADSLADPRVRGLVDVVRSTEYRNLLMSLPGYDSRQTGELTSAN